MTPISTGPTLINRTSPSAISPSRHTSTSSVMRSLYSLVSWLVDLLSPPFVQLGHRELLPARHIGHHREWPAERPRRIDADARCSAQRPRLGGIVDRRVGRSGRQLLHDDRVLLWLTAEGERPFDLGGAVHVDIGIDNDGPFRPDVACHGGQDDLARLARKTLLHRDDHIE